MLRKFRGQSFVEHALLYACVIAAIMAIRIYMKRAVEGRLRSSTDDIGQQGDFNSVSEASNINRTGVIVDTANAGVTTVYSSDVTETTSTNMHLEPWDANAFWSF